MMDSQRLDWLVENHADFGYSSTTSEPVVLGSGKPIHWITTICVRVPCHFLYEWHCYDGKTPRDAIDNAIKAPPCKGHDGECANSSTFRDTGKSHYFANRVAELEALLDSLSVKTFQIGEPLTRRQREIYEFVAAQILSQGYAPTHEEIAQHFGYRSVSTAHQHLESLRLKGWIRREYGSERGTSLVAA